MYIKWVKLAVTEIYSLLNYPTNSLMDLEPNRSTMIDTSFNRHISLLTLILGSWRNKVVLHIGSNLLWKLNIVVSYEVMSQILTANDLHLLLTSHHTLFINKKVYKHYLNIIFCNGTGRKCSVPLCCLIDLHT